MKKNIVLIQARSTSNRLPNKVIQEVSGETLIERIYYIAQKSLLVNDVIVLTSNNKSDDLLCNLMTDKSIKFFRGDLDNVFIRFRDYLKRSDNDNDNFVRLTADCPLLDFKIIDQIIEQHSVENNDYTSTDHYNSFPLGQSVEVVNIDRFMSIDINKLSNIDLEHVTTYLWKNTNLFKCGYVSFNNPTNLDIKKVRLTVDEKEDLILIKEIINSLGYKKNKLPDLNEILNFLETNKDLIEINKDVKQIKV